MNDDIRQSLLAQLETIADKEALLAFAEREPLLLEEQFLEAAHVHAKDSGDAMARRRFEWLAELRQQTTNEIPAIMEALIAAQDMNDLRGIADRWPLTLTEPFVEAIDQLAQQFADAGEQDAAQGLRQRLVGLAQLRTQRDEWAETPQAQAIFEFLNADDDAAALAAFQKHRHLLAHAEAQHTLDDVLQGGDPESQQRLERRRELLRYLRGEESGQ